MNRKSQNVILQATAKALAWDLFVAAGYGRTRIPISIETFHRELRSAARSWSTTHQNLNRRKEQKR